jgi:hypothetical protein
MTNILASAGSAARRHSAPIFANDAFLIPRLIRGGQF